MRASTLQCAYVYAALVCYLKAAAGWCVCGPVENAGVGMPRWAALLPNPRTHPRLIRYRVTPDGPTPPTESKDRQIGSSEHVAAIWSSRGVETRS